MKEKTTSSSVNTLRRSYQALMPKRIRRGIHVLRHLRHNLLRWWIRRASAGRVISGPFRGMKVISAKFHLPFLIGCYEMELHPVWERWKNAAPARILDIGAADGYYAVGFARMFPNAEVVAFESTVSQHAEIRDFAQANGVEERLHVRGHCGSEELREEMAKQGETLIIIDIEGGEAEVLLNDCPGLEAATILVEVHNMFMPGVDALIEEAFRHTHSVERIWARSRTVEDLPVKLGRLAGRLWNSIIPDVIDDGRVYNNWDGVQSWLELRPRAIVS